MKVLYDDKTDLLYLRLDERKQELVNRRVSDDIVLDIGDGGRIVGIEILDASHQIDLSHLFPISYSRPTEVRAIIP